MGWLKRKAWNDDRAALDALNGGARGLALVVNEDGSSYYTRFGIDPIQAHVLLAGAAEQSREMAMAALESTRRDETVAPNDAGGVIQ